LNYLCAAPGAVDQVAGTTPLNGIAHEVFVDEEL
jgi:hypothetical protein